jgi:hypothetical protein
VYKLPHKNSTIEEKVLIDSDADFLACVELFKNPDEFLPLLYVWNHEEESPNKLPSAKKDRDNCSSDDRYSTISRLCKERDNYTCLCCGHSEVEGLTMHCCHLYEIKAHNSMTESEQKEKLKSLKLMSIDEFRNLVTMCEKCHSNFDSHKIGIHPLDHHWIIANSLREKNSSSLTPYRDIHGRSVVFAFTYYEPPLEVLEDRFMQFLEKNKDKTAKNTIHYCHYCLESFHGATGLADKNEHVELCRITRKMNVIS